MEPSGFGQINNISEFTIYNTIKMLTCISQDKSPKGCGVLFVNYRFGEQLSDTLLNMS